jgi:hypothetical protein
MRRGVIARPADVLENVLPSDGVSRLYLLIRKAVVHHKPPKMK